MAKNVPAIIKQEALEGELISPEETKARQPGNSDALDDQSYTVNFKSTDLGEDVPEGSSANDIMAPWIGLFKEWVRPGVF